MKKYNRGKKAVLNRIRRQRFQIRIRRKGKPFNPNSKKYFRGKSNRKIQFGYLLNHVFKNRDKINIKDNIFSNTSKFIIPKKFSLTESPDESYNLIYSVVIYIEKNWLNPDIEINYKDCETLHLDAQMFLDIILKEFLKFISSRRINGLVRISGLKDTHESVRKILYSVGTLAIHKISDINYPDVIKYPLCVRRVEKNANQRRISRLKETDATELVDYVIDCLSKFQGKSLTVKKRKDFSDVIGEVLINCEEHSTLGRRYSVGYFTETKTEKNHYGEFKLLIFNFGDSIYEKFSDPNCPNKEIVNRMKELSENFTKSGIFKRRKFEEETLWTLYSLQDGVTSTINWRRGHGSIKFIESFFNIKGNKNVDNVSRLNILSGNTHIIFDGSHEIKEIVKEKNGKRTKFKVMAFNDSGNIELAPDANFVKFADFYFPGTMITANILINDDDIKHEDKYNDVRSNS